MLRPPRFGAGGVWGPSVFCPSLPQGNGMHPLRLSAGRLLAVIPGAVAVCRGRFPRHGDDGMGEPRREAQALLLRLGEGVGGLN